MLYYVHVSDRPFSMLAEGVNGLILGRWEKKGKAYRLPVQGELGLCQVLSAMLATTTRLVSFAASRFVPCSPFGPDLYFNLGEVLLSTARVQQGADPGGSMLPHSPRLLRSLTSPTANGERKPPGTPRMTEAIPVNSRIQVRSPSHRAFLLNAAHLYCIQESLLIICFLSAS